MIASVTKGANSIFGVADWEVGTWRLCSGLGAESETCCLNHLSGLWTTSGGLSGCGPVLEAPLRVAGRNLGRANTLGPSTEYLAGLFLRLKLGKFCPMFFCCNWTCLLPSHLGRHGDSALSFSRQNGRSLVSCALTTASPFFFLISSWVSPSSVFQQKKGRHGEELIGMWCYTLYGGGSPVPSDFG